MSITVTAGETLPYLPGNPVCSGYRFTGWQDESGSAFTAATPVTADMTLTAQWETIPVDPGVVAVTFNTSGGRWSNGATGALSLEPARLADGSGYLLAAAPEDPIRPGYTFGGWLCGQSDDGTGSVSGDGIQTVGSNKFVEPAKCTYQRSITLTAYWQANGNMPADRLVTLEGPDSVDEIQWRLNLSSVTEVRITSPDDGYQLVIDKPLYIPDNKRLSMDAGEMLIDAGGSLTVAPGGSLDMNDQVQAGGFVAGGALYNFGQVYASNISCVNSGGILNVGTINGDLTAGGNSYISYAEQTGGTVTMNGGTIYQMNLGPAYSPASDESTFENRAAAFDMFGGSVYSMTQTDGSLTLDGGGFNRMSQYGGSCTMYSGTIYGMEHYGGDFILDGGTIDGDVFFNYGSFIMDSGIINGSVTLDNGTFELYGGTINGGMELSSYGYKTFTMDNGTIYGGVTQYTGTFTMNGGMILPGPRGGSALVYVSGGEAYLDAGIIGDIQTTGQALYIYSGSVTTGSNLIVYGNCFAGNRFGVITVDEVNGGVLIMNGGVVCNYGSGYAIIVLTNGDMATVINAKGFDVSCERGSDESGGGQDWTPYILLEIASDGTENRVNLNTEIWDYRALVVYPKPQTRRVHKNREEGQA